MRIYLLLSIAAALVSAVCGVCDACVDGICLKKHLLPKDTGGIGAIDRKNNIYYVTTKDNGHELISQCSLNTLICSDKTNIWNLTDLTVDQNTGNIYATGSERKGIYQVDLENNQVDLLVDEDIKYIAYKDKLYYAPQRGGIYTLDDGIQQLIPGTTGHIVTEFVIDKNNDIYFKYRENGRMHVRKLKYGSVSANKFSDPTNRVSIDKDGNIMLINLPSFTVYRVTNDEPVEVGVLTDWVIRPLFDGDNNLIYTANSDDYFRYYLKQVPDVQCSVQRSGLGRNYKPTIIETVRKTTPKA